MFITGRRFLFKTLGQPQLKITASKSQGMYFGIKLNQAVNEIARMSIFCALIVSSVSMNPFTRIVSNSNDKIMPANINELVLLWL